MVTSEADGNLPLRLAAVRGSSMRVSTGVTSSAQLLAAVEQQDRQNADEQRVRARAELSGGRPSADRYPERLMPIAGAEIDWPDGDEARVVRVRYEAFCRVREAALAGYGFNTARAYWGDLEDIFWWAEARGVDPLKISNRSLSQYCGLLRRRKYSENTVHRRLVAHRKLAMQQKAMGLSKADAL